jgi:hypothetical protein
MIKLWSLSSKATNAAGSLKPFRNRHTMKINTLPWSKDLTFLVTQQLSRNYDLHYCQHNFIICVRMPIVSAGKETQSSNTGQEV